MAHPIKRFILVPIANDAQCAHGQYVDIGRNAKVRIDDAVSYAKKIHGKPAAWCFGAGAGEGYQGGKTLAYWGRNYLKGQLLGATMFANEDDKKVFGTYEEMRWVITTARSYYPKDELTFIFFAQGRPLWRIRFIRWLFFRDVSAKFVRTRQTLEIPISHELKGYLRLLLIKGRIIQPRG